jgi:NADH-ubiquinone oxidoreductase chain 2
MIGINQSHLRTIIAYSSITHIGWISSILFIIKPILTITYFIFYCAITIPLFLIIRTLRLINRNQFNKLNLMSPLIQLLVPLILLSLSGIPPFTGFIPKWITISTLCTHTPFILIVLITGAMINAYFYINIIFNSILSINVSQQTLSYSVAKTKPIIIIALASLFALPLIII